MKFASILKRARTLASAADISTVDFLAVQINIEGEEKDIGKVLLFTEFLQNGIKA